VALGMHEQNLAILKGLVSVAWADGQVDKGENELIEALLVAFGASASESLEVRRFASEPRTLDDVPIHDLSADDRRVLLGHAVVLTFLDGKQDDKERALLEQLCSVLHIPAVEARGITEVAEGRAKELLPLLG
jgi:tellurite resistance protein